MIVPVFLSPGEIHASRAPAVISTVLGSCVAICLWDRTLAAGGMNHFLLPHRKDSHASARYGDVAVVALLDRMATLGCRNINLRAKVFGGAAVLSVGAQADAVGTQNLEVALSLLQRFGIPVVARRTGGQHGLFIRFNTRTGSVMVRELATPIASEQHVVRN